jgi:multisubunit Na+/H+ antiporter MnhG subunit
MAVIANLLVAGLITVAVVAEIACAVGVWRTRSALDRLHFLGPATIIGPLAIAIATWLQRGVDQVSIKATLAMALLLFTGPLLSYVTARAVLAREDRR